MNVWIGAAVLAAALACSAPLSAGANGAGPAKAEGTIKPKATELSGRRVDRRHVYRPYAPAYAPTYYARPVTYRPYPYGVPAPFFLGFAYLP